MMQKRMAMVVPPTHGYSRMINMLTIIAIVVGLLVIVSMVVFYSCCAMSGMISERERRDSLSGKQ